MREINHYDWLEKNLPAFFEKHGVSWDQNAGIIACHGDKGYSYQTRWESVGIPFHKGMAVYLLSYVRPYDKEVRETPDGWVDPCLWVMKNYTRFFPEG